MPIKEKLRTFAESVAFDVGMAALLESSAAADRAATDSPGDSAMRPTRSLECVVGIVVYFITRSGEGRPVKNREVKNCWLDIFYGVGRCRDGVAYP